MINSNPIGVALCVLATTACSSPAEPIRAPKDLVNGRAIVHGVDYHYTEIATFPTPGFAVYFKTPQPGKRELDVCAPIHPEPGTPLRFELESGSSYDFVPSEIGLNAVPATVARGDHGAEALGSLGGRAQLLTCDAIRAAWVVQHDSGDHIEIGITGTTFRASTRDFVGQWAEAILRKAAPPAMLADTFEESALDGTQSHARATALATQFGARLRLQLENPIDGLQIKETFLGGLGTDFVFPLVIKPAANGAPMRVVLDKPHDLFSI